MSVVVFDVFRRLATEILDNWEWHSIFHAQQRGPDSPQGGMGNMETNRGSEGMQGCCGGGCCGGAGAQPTKFEHLRGLLQRMDRTVDSTRDRRMGKVMVEPTTTPAPIPFPRAAQANVSGKPRAVAKSLQDFEAAFARVSGRQAG